MHFTEYGFIQLDILHTEAIQVKYLAQENKGPGGQSNLPPFSY